MLHTIGLDTPFDVLFLYFWEPGDIPYWDGSRKILTCLDFMTVFRPVSASGLKGIISDQIARWDFGNLFVLFGIPKIIAVDSDGFFSGMFNKTFQETLLIPVHTIERVKNKAIGNEGFN